MWNDEAKLVAEYIQVAHDRHPGLTGPQRRDAGRFWAFAVDMDQSCTLEPLFPKVSFLEPHFGVTMAQYGPTARTGLDQDIRESTLRLGCAHQMTFHSRFLECSLMQV